MNNFITNNKVKRLRNSTAPGAAPVVTDIVNVSNSEGVCFFILMGTTAAGEIGIQLQGSKENNPGTMVNIGDSHTVTLEAINSNNILIPFEVASPPADYPYLQLLLNRTGDQGINGVISIHYGLRAKPVNPEWPAFLLFAPDVSE